MSRRIRKVTWLWDDVEETWTTTPEADLRFVYDGWNLVQEIDGLVTVESGVTDVAREYTWGLDLSGQGGSPSPAGIHGAGGIGGLLATHWTANTTSSSDDNAYLYFYDANGNVGQLLEATGSGAGTVAAKYEYYPFGGLLVADGVAAEANPFRFSTKYRDNETGCYYYGYRYLRTKHGRWLSRDPIGEVDSADLYQFVQNDPIDYVDNRGLRTETRILEEKKCGQNIVYAAGTQLDIKDYYLDLVARTWIDLTRADIADGPVNSEDTLGIITTAWKIIMTHDKGDSANNDRRYRLFSNARVDFTCCKDTLISARLNATGDVGKEGLFDPPMGRFDKPRLTCGDSCATFAYQFKGRPNSLAEPLHWAYKYRKSVYIWHRVEGEVCCENGKGVYKNLKLDGSKFPSHVLYAQGVEKARLRQGPARLLWNGDPADGELVE